MVYRWLQVCPPSREMQYAENSPSGCNSSGLILIVTRISPVEKRWIVGYQQNRFELVISIVLPMETVITRAGPPNADDESMSHDTQRLRQLNAAAECIYFRFLSGRDLGLPQRL